MKKLIVLMTFLANPVFAIMPAEQVPITDNLIRKYGFEIKVEKSNEETEFSISAPPIIENNWHLVASQIYPFHESETGMLVKNSVPQSKESTKVSIYFNHRKSDAFVGLYYECRETKRYYCGATKEKLYLIESVNNY